MKLFNSQPLIDWTMRVAGMAPRLTVVTGKDGLIWVDDGRDTIAIVHPNRAALYSRGIARRRRRVTDHKYLGDGLVPIRHGDRVVNVGANIGEVSTSLADRGASVLAIEPDAAARACLTANVTGQTVEIIPFGVWKENGPLRFFLATESADTSAINPTERSITIEARTLDTIVRDAGIEHLRLIAGDAEGAEPEVLLGASATLPRTDYVSLDCGYERQGESTFQICSALLTDAGFEILRTGRKQLIARNRRVAAGVDAAGLAG